LFLKSLEIQGFKSFPDKTLLSFGKGITAVVGPNGSGKSNISDAIRWVLGEMSAKSLRGGRMEDIIFGGTVLRRAQGFAEVTLTIDNAGRELAFDGDEISVTRRYYRSGESEYLLNRTEVRLRDINELFMDTGLGRDGYSVIGQGRIAEIVSARSEDRREIFEEAAGISKYRYRKEESERRLSATEDNLTRLRDILTELEERVGPLGEQAEKAKRYIELAGEKKTLEVGLWLYTLDRHREALREQDNRLALAHAQYEEIENKLDTVAADIEAAFMETQKVAAQAEEYKETAKNHEESAAKNEADAAVIDNDVAHNDSNIERITAEMQQIENLGEEQTGEAQRRQEDLAQLEQRQQKLETELAQCEKGVLELANRGDELSSKIEGANALLSFLNIEIAQTKQNKSSAESSIAHIDERLGAIDIEKTTREERLGASKSLFDDASNRLTLLNDRSQELSNSLKGYELKAGTRRDRLRVVDEKARALSLKLSEKNQRAAMLTDLERHMEGFSHSVKAIMRERDRGLLSGIHGPVSRLMKVPPNYAVAIETALGGAAQNIVVSSEDAAKAGISFLKHSDGGRATFLPLTSVRGNTLTQHGVSDCDGYVGVANELVQYDNQYDNIMKNLLGRTVVAENLDSAVVIAKRFGYGFRIVTLDGQLVNAGGSLTGGSLNRTAGLLTRAGEIETLKKEAEKLQSDLQTIESEKKAAQTEMSSLEAAISGISGELMTVQEDMIRVEGEKKRAQEQSDALGEDVGALEAEKATCAQRRQELEAGLAETDAQIAARQADASVAQEELEKLGISKSEIASKREAQSEQFTNLRLEHLTCSKDIEAARRVIEELERQKLGHADRVAEFKAQIRQLEEKNRQAQGCAQQLRAQAAELRLQAESSLSEAQKTVSARQEIEHSNVKRRSEERSLSDDKEKISRELARLEERKAAAQVDYDALIAKLWEEYELTRSEAEKTASRVTEPTVTQKRLNTVKKEIKDLGDVNVGAIEEYKEVSERYKFLKEQTEDVEKSKAELMELISDLTSKMRNIFAKQFEEISHNFSHIFVELFGGGSARLEMTEPDNVLSSGIEIIVQPPGKIIKSLTALSGGEQSFIAIALYFSILKVRPSPFCVLDEIEAALDDANVARFAAYLRRMCTNIQFIVITHRRGTMDEADVLYGVTMQDEGVSKLLTLDVEQLVEKLGIKA
jgi:chromosome segregation protein